MQKRVIIMWQLLLPLVSACHIMDEKPHESNTILSKVEKIISITNSYKVELWYTCKHAVAISF